MPVSPKLLIDAGNQRLKWRAGAVNQAVDWNVETELADLKWPASEDAGLALVSSVRSAEENETLDGLLQQRGYRALYPQVENEKIGLICGYRDSSQLGVDRWLAMLACWNKLQKGFVYVGAGTALTIDLVYATGKHGGGYITAGLGLGREALLSRSEKLLNQYTPSTPCLSLGNDTASAINNGALVAATEMIKGVQRAAGMNGAALVVSGGDAELLTQHLRGSTLWSNIVLDGLATWFEGSELHA
jgi:type III pantothenate kinase